MSKFLSHDMDELGRLTPIARVKDREIWNLLVTPTVKALLGKITSSRMQLLETTAGFSPEDKVFNQNGHRIYGQDNGVVRYPYMHSFYKTEKGAFIVRRDGIKFEALCYYGDPGKGQLVLKVALRDRRYDGTRQANDCPLEHFPYDHPRLNGRFFPDAKTVELYVFSYWPNTRVAQSGGGKDLEEFCANPFKFLDRPQLFRSLFERAWESERAPGQYSAPVPDAAELTAGAFEVIARKYGYDFIEICASHYHVVRWAQHIGYKFHDPKQEAIIQGFTDGIARLKAEGRKLTRQQESWICVAQGLRPLELIPEGLYLDGPVWPQDNITLPNLWLYKPLHAKATQLPTLPEGGIGA